MTKKIIVSYQYFTTVDDDDYEYLNQFTWYGYPTKRGGYIYPYRLTKWNGKHILMHREIIKPNKGMVVDHISGNTLDNRKCNLRICTNAENVRNSRIRKNNKSGIKGVSFNSKSGKWVAHITVNFKCIALGFFPKKEDAARVYRRAAKKYFGSFART